MKIDYDRLVMVNGGDTPSIQLRFIRPIQLAFSDSTARICERVSYTIGDYMSGDIRRNNKKTLRFICMNDMQCSIPKDSVLIKVLPKKLLG